MFRQSLLLLVLFSLASCSEFGPFVDSRREAGQTNTVGQSKPDRIAVCYNPIWDNDTEIDALATSACASHKITPDGKSYFNCRFFSPNTAFYKCAK